MIIEETWRPIEDYPGYDISNMGRVRSYWIKGRNGGLASKPQSIRVSSLNGSGYPIVSLRKDGYPSRVNIHELVAKAFLGPKPKDTEICHNDGNKQNNLITNLRYDTRSSNQLDTIKHQKNKTGFDFFVTVLGTEWRSVKIL